MRGRPTGALSHAGKRDSLSAAEQFGSVAVDPAQVRRVMIGLLAAGLASVGEDATREFAPELVRMLTGQVLARAG